jgi:molybdopterin molybdotransferase
MAQAPAPIPLAEARRRLIEAVEPLPDEALGLADAVGRTLAADLAAPIDLPPHANSALDGFAFAAASVPGELELSGEVFASGDPEPLTPGTAVRIATGGVMPDGADAVVGIENADVSDGRVLLSRPASPGDAVRQAGSDVRAGALVLAAGQRLTPLAASVAASLGVAELRCRVRPRVAILTTGDELVAPGRPLRRGQIYESNGLLLAASLRVVGCDVVSVSHCGDTLPATRDAIAAAAAAADLVLTSGGVSVGPRDFVRAALEELGARELYWRVAIQPGKPGRAGVLTDGTIVLGLPGNPLAIVVGLALFVAPLLERLAGGSPPAEPRSRPARTDADLHRLADRVRLVPVVLDGDEAVALGADRSDQLATAARATGLALVGMGADPLPAGTAVPVVPLLA